MSVLNNITFILVNQLEMASQIYTHIKQVINVRQHSQILRGNELAELPIIHNGYLIIEDGMIAEYGEMENYKKNYLTHEVCEGAVLPCWCDSHTHIVFAGSRENEFVEKIKGSHYAEIAAKGGGILNSAKN
ncbi:MAG: hypothetical protein ABIO81_05830 [Ginsengibacter sp.]